MARRLPEPVRGDEGTTLIEVMISMSLMAVVTVVFTSGIFEIYRWVDRADSSYEAQGQINTAFIRLDKEIRYARSISDPAQVSGDWYVEYLVSLNSVDTCVELRLATASKELQRRTWPQSSSPLTPTSWTTLASNVSGGTPFTTVAADKNTLTGFRFQRLTVNVTSSVGLGAAGTTRQTNVTFTALNAVSPSNSSTCVEARGVSS
jgi:type II secretory pathway component PulJ